MSHSTLAKFQIGKNGLTEGTIKSLELALKNHKQIRISVLESNGRDKTKMKSLAQEILKKIPHKCNYRIIGFTIILIKS
ncbi:MAG: YhbY family RNA-binding protein [Nanoarchaeota archaeon]